MSIDSGFTASEKYERVGPDYFGYYSSEIANLLSQDDDAFPVSDKIPELPKSKYEEGRKKSLINQGDNSGPLYSNGVGAGLSDFTKDRLKSLLRQSVISLSSEVDEMVEPVFAAYHLQSRIKCKSDSLNCRVIASDDLVQGPSKRIKVSSSSSSARLLPQTSNVNPQRSTKISDDVQFLLENDSAEVAEMVKRHSSELSKTLGYMEEKLEFLLDTIMLKCRSMTLAEKQQLQSLIQKLPARNLVRVVELLRRNRPAEEQSCDEVIVDLETEDNASLWRLYYYVEAVDKAKSLSCSLVD
ncbi:uncharacterized protein LOC114186008 isoform X3 [Vigna unguiculata]|uniref:NET domain-containing protein n=2 Tax=Vigna unguiculata TaxID=3917 RepID=A0A4D6M6V0_VIGUN|nr:uncharacterized protein LOC114186008 isoform X3 [Vigna unguiculata]XP_027929826.1 uncharacterized protein LOC114186008 isoform X3 [Vigna unguiculata]XP_027929834.1 uncharacterized protein LOC114186008 isoform X3 [Vigna unguiculata]QCD96410.1 hypothetical protein DEO72_LG6g1112 [Vigna unguiculata]